MQFPNARLELRVEDGVLQITSDQFARAVHLSGDADGDEFGWFFEDNYFDLMPGVPKTVRVLGQHSHGQVTAKAYYSPHETTVSWSR